VHVPAPGTTTIGVHGLRARGFHGVLPEEREQGQDFLVDATLEVGSPATDDLSRTADYGALAERLAAAVAADPVDLIETLAQRLLAICLETPLVQAATITVHKPSAPIALPFDDVTVAVSGRRPARGVLSLGSNLGDRLAHLQAAVQLLSAHAGEVAVSDVYETDPVGGPEQEPYLNVIAVVPSADPFALWQFTSAVEAARQRTRDVRWGPRTLDIDLITVGDQRLATPELTLPHPRAAERAFVLVPWLALNPNAELPGAGPVAGLVARLDASGVRRTDLRLVP
jgi:dihydroneopterin aldolase/2-amino-4-hydroxy-6-hydroxymethyldihydropteridine diphosphokinase